MKLKIRCYACGRLTTSPECADTKDCQWVYVGRECYKLIKSAGDYGYQPPLGGPRLYELTEQAKEYYASVGLPVEQWNGGKRI